MVTRRVQLLEIWHVSCCGALQRVAVEGGIYTMNIDMLIKMGREMPAPVSNAMLRVRSTLLKLLDRGASGEF